MSRYKNPEKRKEAKTRKEAINQAEVEFKAILATRNQVRKVKKSTAEGMLEKVKQATLMYGGLPKPLRDPLSWEPRSYNEDRQLIDFITYTYCKYKPPLFMFGIFDIKWHVSSSSRREYLDWFKVIAEGNSFYKQVKDFMTRKEVHVFLNLKNDKEIEENIWYAKCKATGMISELTSVISNRLCYREYRYSNLFNQLPSFVHRFISEIDRHSLSDIMDFLIHKDYHDPSFELKNRTFGSLVKLSNDWHREQQAIRNRSANFDLAPCQIPDFEWHEKKEDVKWKINQILTSNELYKEGSKMKHCVGGYAESCKEGRSYIFSMTKSDFLSAPEKKVTIELNNKHEIVQVRGKCNRLPDGDENRVIRRWCADRNIKYKSGF